MTSIFYHLLKHNENGIDLRNIFCHLNILFQKTCKFKKIINVFISNI